MSLEESVLIMSKHAERKQSQRVAVQVWKAMQDEVRTVAVKVLNTSNTGNDRLVQAFWREIERLAECRDMNVLQLYGVSIRGVSSMEI